MKRLVVLLCALLPNATIGAEYSSHEFFERPTDFSVDLNRMKTEPQYGNDNIETTIKRVGISIREQFSKSLWLGLFGGYAFITQTNNAVTEGRELSGYYAGLGLNLTFLKTERSALFFAASYTYQNVDDKKPDQNIDLWWHEPTARFGIRTMPGANLSLYGGVAYGLIEGQERTSGNINRTREVKRASETGAFGGVELIVERNGYIGVSAHSGIGNDIGIYLGRRY